MELIDNYESRCKPKDYPLIKDCLESFYKARRVYLETKTFSNQILAENEMYGVFYLAKGYMSMGDMSEEKFYFIKTHLEEGIDD